MSFISAQTKEDRLIVEYFLLSVRKMNLTVVLVQPSLNISFEAAMIEDTQLKAGNSDVVVGIVPLVPIVVSEMTEPSIPYIYGAVKCYVPCPKPISMVN